MPARNKALKGGSNSLKKVKIKPFSKPPTLPPNFYEDTSKELLQGTLDVLRRGQAQQKRGVQRHYGSPTPTSSSTAAGDENQRPSLSLQNSYTSVVNLVSHQFGPRLYQDLRSAMQQAAEEVLPRDHEGTGAALADAKNAAAAASAGGTANTAILEYVQQQYQLYVDYILLCKHVFLPLDRTHLWQDDGNDGVVIKRTMATSHTHLSLWEVGLCQFRNRLTELHLDELVYGHWFQMLVDDWSGVFALRSLLQATWHMWQELHLLPLIMTQLQPDLEVFLQRQSQQHMEGGASSSASSNNSGDGGDKPYSADHFVRFVYDRWMHISYQWTFLPKTWLCMLLEVHLLLPHLHQDWLLAPQHFYPLLEQELIHSLSAASGAASPGTASATNTAAAGANPLSPSHANPAAAHHYASNQNAMVKLWMLAGRLPHGYKQVATCIAQYARTKGMALVNPTDTKNSNSNENNTDNESKQPEAVASAQNNNNMIADLLDLQQHLVRLVSRLPHGTDHIALKSVWEEVVNAPLESPSIAESLAKFVDQILKSNKKMDQYALHATQSVGSGGPSSNDLLSRIISGIFVHLQAKDIFEAFYKRDLAKRLLWNRVVSMDVEKQFVSLLKAECGAGYTSKMEGMFQDIDWSREAMSRYKSTQAGPGHGGEGAVEMEAQVLTTGYWPVYPQFPQLILPESLKIPQERFTDHYKTKYQGRRMTWQYALGHCIVRANNMGKTKNKVFELVVSLCQALVLIQFNTPDKQWTLPQLQEAIGLEDRDEVARVLVSLALGKDGTRILRKLDYDAEPGKKKKIRQTVDDRDKFVINGAFDSNQRRIRVTNIMWKETKAEREKTVEAVSRDRLYMIDASLVRIMKARKTILHQQLIPQVLEQVKVPCQPADVKKRIESLIEREYMERDPKDRSRYNYLA